MSSSIDSLSGLAEVAKEVESILLPNVEQECAIRMDRMTFVKLQSQINALQVLAPNHKGVVEARVRWFNLAAASFEMHAVRLAEEGKWPYRLHALNFPHDNESVELLAGTETINHFLRRHYLKDSFGYFFTRILALYRRIANAPVYDQVQNAFTELANSLEDRLLDGRL